MIIRRLQLKDAEGMYEWMQDEDVTCFLAQDFASKTLEDCRNFIMSAAKEEDKNLHRYGTIFRNCEFKTHRQEK